MKRNNIFCFVLLISLCTGTAMAQEWWDAVVDGSFEVGHGAPPWTATSSVGGSIVTDQPGPARTGTWYATFGAPDANLASETLQQEVTLGSSDAVLEFWYMRPFDSENGGDSLQVFIDGTSIWQDTAEPGGGPIGSYARASVEMNAFADGWAHTLRFAMTSDGTTNTGHGSQWLVDDVSIMTRNALQFEADFTWTPEFPEIDDEVQFTDTSGGDADGWSWDFGDGATSNLQNPTHTYVSGAGEYQVTLTVTWSAQAEQDTIVQTVGIYEPLLAFFSWTPEAPRVGETIAFFNGSSGPPDSSSWTFGDGSTSTERSPTHIYPEAGSYDVSLTISRDADNATHYTQHTVTVTADLYADFTWQPANPVVGDEIVLTDASWGEPTTWSWSFPDGTTATGPTATVTVAEPGAFDVSLTVTRESDAEPISSTTTRTIDVAIPPLDAAFAWAPTNPLVDEVVHFTDQTEGNIASWRWAFGDGSESTVKNPVHIYTTEGTFTVLFEVTDIYDQSAQTTETVTVTADSYIADFNWVPENPMAGQQVQFQDLSRGGAVGWFWEFGDGAISHEQHPTHRFLTAGVFGVTLTASFEGEGEVTRAVTHEVSVSDVDLEADFVWTPIAPKIDDVVRFSDNSRGNPTSWAWDFGDGATSILPNPSHIYRTPGNYMVKLTVARESDGSSDLIRQSVVVDDLVSADFSWTPSNPKANVTVQFTEQMNGDISSRFWSFGDGSTDTRENPPHIFEQPGQFQVSLIAYGPDGTVVATALHTVAVIAADVQPAIEVNHDEADIGQAVDFQVTGVEMVDRVEWDFAGLGCDGNREPVVCVPTTDDDCLTARYIYSTPGLKPVRLTVFTAGQAYGPASTAVEIRPNGICSGPPLTDFSWWPPEPKVGERVRCVDYSTGPPILWQWTFVDGAISINQHPIHTFSSQGARTIRLAVSNDNGTGAVEKSVRVDPVVPVCPNQVCDPGESSWTCAADCGGPENGTWRNGRKGTVQTIPAAAGGVPGANGTFWLTGGTIVNAGAAPAQAVVEFVPDDQPLVIRSAGPLTIPPRTAVSFDNLVTELFSTAELGSLWVDSDLPVIVNTRTFNQSDQGTVGQGIVGTLRTDTLADGEGVAFLVGLKQNEYFRTNLLVQEVDGKPATVIFEVFNHAGQLAGAGSFVIPGRSKWQKPITVLGIDYLQAGYARLRVDGDGRLSALASVVDRGTGDATTVDAVHRQRAEAGNPSKTVEVGDSRYVVAVVARTPGANQTVWRSEVSILNPAAIEQQLELRYVPDTGGVAVSNVTIEAHSMFSSADVIGEVFPQAADGAGALHIYGEGGLVVNSRAYNLLPSQTTVGQAIPGLTSGDLARPGEVWLLDSLRETSAFRCNIGFAEYEGSEADVTVVLYDVDGGAFTFLASKSYTVPALGQFQVNRVLRDMGLEGVFPNVLGYVYVTSQNGAVYAYASIVDNGTGDGTTILAKRQ